MKTCRYGTMSLNKNSVSPNVKKIVSQRIISIRHVFCKNKVFEYCASMCEPNYIRL